MIPIGDSLRSRTFPLVNYAIILANFFVFFIELQQRNLNAWKPLRLTCCGRAIPSRSEKRSTGPDSKPSVVDAEPGRPLHPKWFR